MKRDLWSSFHNQALLSNSGGIMFGANYENRFGIPELGTCTSAITIPAGHATLGAIYSHFGYRDFSRQMAGVACGLPLSESVAAGIQIDYFNEKTYGEYSASQAVTIEAGLLYAFNDNVKIGIHLFNPIPGSVRRKEMVSALRTGVGATLAKGIFAGMELEFTTDGYIDVRTGFEYELSRSLWLRGGFRSQHSSFCFGIGYRLKPATIDISFSTHDKLGVTSSISLIFKI